MEKEFAVAAGLLYLQCVTNEQTTKQDKKESCDVFLKSYAKYMSEAIETNKNDNKDR